MRRRGFLKAMMAPAAVVALVPRSEAFVPGNLPVKEITSKGRWTIWLSRKEITSKERWTFWLSRYSGHRIQISPTEAVQFADGRVLANKYVTDLLKKTEAFRKGDISAPDLTNFCERVLRAK